MFSKLRLLVLAAALAVGCAALPEEEEAAATWSQELSVEEPAPAAAEALSSPVTESAAPALCGRNSDCHRGFLCCNNRCIRRSTRARCVNDGNGGAIE